MRKCSTSTWNVTSFMASGTTSSNQAQRQVDTFIYLQCLTASAVETHKDSGQFLISLSAVSDASMNRRMMWRARCSGARSIQRLEGSRSVCGGRGCYANSIEEE